MVDHESKNLIALYSVPQLFVTFTAVTSHAFVVLREL